MGSAYSSCRRQMPTSWWWYKAQETTQEIQKRINELQNAIKVQERLIESTTHDLYGMRLDPTKRRDAERLFKNLNRYRNKREQLDKQLVKLEHRFDTIEDAISEEVQGEEALKTEKSLRKLKLGDRHRIEQNMQRKRLLDKTVKEIDDAIHVVHMEENTEIQTTARMKEERQVNAIEEVQDDSLDEWFKQEKATRERITYNTIQKPMMVMSSAAATSQEEAVEIMDMSRIHRGQEEGEEEEELQFDINAV